jgi:hypothetical protein
LEPFSEYLNFETTNAQFSTANLKKLCKHVKQISYYNQGYAMHYVFESSLKERNSISGNNVLYYIKVNYTRVTLEFCFVVCVCEFKEETRFLVSSVKRACILALKND